MAAIASSSSLLRAFHHSCDDPSSMVLLPRFGSILGGAKSRSVDSVRLSMIARGIVAARVSSHAESVAVPKLHEAANGLSKCCRVSEELQRIVGHAELPRHQVVKSVWNYIHEHNLQDPTNKRTIVCNADLAQVLGVDKTDMFQLSRLLSRHLTYSGESKPRPPKPSSSSSKGAGISRPVRLSPQLKSFLETDATEMVRSEVVKKMWDYIKEHNLQDTVDRRRVICDAKLRDLLQCESLLGISITKYLTPHLLKD